MFDNRYELEIDGLTKSFHELIAELDLKSVGVNYDELKCSVLKIIENVNDPRSDYCIDDLHDVIESYFDELELSAIRRILFFDAISVDITTPYDIWIQYMRCECCNTSQMKTLLIVKHKSVEDKIMSTLKAQKRE